MSVILINKVIVGNLDHPIRRNVDNIRPKTDNSPNLFQGQHTSLQDGHNFTLFKVLTFLGPDLNLVPEGQFRVLVKREDLISVGAKVLHLLLDNLLNAQGVGLLLLACG
jgi:hypothetical protein